MNKQTNKNKTKQHPQPEKSVNITSSGWLNKCWKYHLEYFSKPASSNLYTFSAPPRHFLLYLSRLLFFRAETSWLFSFKPCAWFKTIFFLNRTGGYDAAWRNRALGPTKNWPKTDFQWKLHTNRVFCIFLFCFRIHFNYVLSYLFGLFGVRTCVSILWHTSLPKNATFAWKNSEKPWFWRFLVIFVFLTWRHCGVTQGMFVLFLVPMDSGGS